MHPIPRLVRRLAPLVAPLLASLAIGCSSADPGVSDAPALAPAAELPGVAEDAARQCALGETVEGADVSYYQGAIDWPAAARGGLVFAIARVADGPSFVDPQFATNWRGMKAAGVIRGAYQFFRPTDDPSAQARLFLAQLDASGGLSPGDLPPALDLEVTDGVAAPVVLARAQVWLDRVEAATGRTPLIYTAPGFWEELDAAPSFGRYPLWLANWGARCPAKPETWSRWSFWQSTDRGEVPGIEGEVDRDRFNGSKAALLAFAAGAPRVEPARPIEAPRAEAPKKPASPRKAEAPRRSSKGQRRVRTLLDQVVAVATQAARIPLPR